MRIGRALGALSLAFLAMRSRAEGVAPASSSTAAAVTVGAEPVIAPAAWAENGIEYCLGATALSVFNGSPLSYTPFELGVRFSNGLRLRGGIDIFYYEGLDTDSKDLAKGTRNYSYEMHDVRLSLLYAVPLPGKIRPVAGATFEVVGGTRKLAGPDIVAPPTQDAWGFLGDGAILGGEWRMAEHWSLEALGRYTFSYGSVGSVTALGLDGVFLF